MTIFAPASGAGRAAIAVVRVSGSGTAALIEGVAGSCPEPRRLSLRSLRHPITGELLDRALVVWMPAPESFTGEDMAEFHLHGGLAVRKAVLDALACVPNSRLAHPGEFAQRAFLNERLDLTEAEGIADLVDAETEEQRRQALRQLGGHLGRHVATWREQAIALLARAEAALDFSDEGDVDADALTSNLEREAESIRNAIQVVLGDGRRGERLRDGFVVVLAGAPNSGKSTLLNALAKREAAIVSDIPGTTRDAIEVRCDLGGLPVILVDTAGLREACDLIEAAGVARAERYVGEADLVLHIRPCDKPEDGLDAAFQGDRTILVRTKRDLHNSDPDDIGLPVSALTGAGLEDLLRMIEERLQVSLGSAVAVVTRQRHRDALNRTCLHLDRVASGAAKATELVAEDIRLAVQALGEVSGHVGVEAVLDRLFSGFCIGK